MVDMAGAHVQGEGIPMYINAVFDYISMQPMIINSPLFDTDE